MERPKTSFFKRNKEKIKVGCIIGTSLSTIGAIVALIALHLANPALGVVTIPMAIQMLVAIVLKKFPKSLDEIKDIAGDMLKDLPEDLKEKFIDELSTQYTSRGATARTIAESTEPIPTPSETEEVYLPARRHIRTGTYDIYTPRAFPQV